MSAGNERQQQTFGGSSSSVLVHLRHDDPENATRTTVTLHDQPSGALLVSNIPYFLSVPEFIQQCSPFETEIRHLQIVGVATPEAYGAVITIAPEAAGPLRSELNLKPISALSNKMLLVGHCDPLEQESRAPSPASHHQQQQQQQQSQSEDATGPLLSPSPSNNNNTAAHNNPTCCCSICLDPLSDAAVLHTLCGHEFHLGCFARVEDESCPLCRFNITAQRTVCGSCGEVRDLWMCLLCGAVQCGRQVRGHAQEHFITTGHRLAVQAGGGFRVWDYEGDSFIHRVVAASTLSDEEANRPSSSVASMPWWVEDDTPQEAEACECAIIASKTQLVADFYSKLLEDQLSRQHAYYTGLLKETSQQEEYEQEDGKPEGEGDDRSKKNREASAKEDDAMLLTSLAISKFVREECEERRALCTSYSAELRALLGTDQLQLTAGLKILRERRKHLQDEVETAEATVASMQGGVTKLQSMRDSVACKDAAAKDEAARLKKRAAAVEQELEVVYQELCGDNGAVATA